MVSVTAQLRFLREFISRPGSVGSVAPSSRRLARTMVNGHDLARARVVVEAGPGTGSLTEYFLELIPDRNRFVAIEHNPNFVEHLRRRFPGVRIVHGGAENTPQILDQLGLPPADVVFSGLPWASFSSEFQSDLLASLHDALAPGGYFATFAYKPLSYLPRARRFRRLLEDTFDAVDASPIVWGNVPPAFAYQCRK